MRRVVIDYQPYAGRPADKAPWAGRGEWPCRWVCCPQAVEPPFVTAYRRRFRLDAAATVRVHVSADERYELFVDGHRVGRGPERGDPENWLFETYDLDFEPGEHTVVARVWSLGRMAPTAQMTVYPGFIFSPEDEEFVDLLGTGVADWQAKVLPGYSFAVPDRARLAGARTGIDGSAFPWGFERGEGDGWRPAETRHRGMNADEKADWPPCHLLRPATLPAMLERHRYVGSVRLVAELGDSDPKEVPVRAADQREEEAAEWQSLLAGEGTVTVPAGAKRRVLVDLEDYYCAYPEVTTSGGEGARVRIGWAESLFTHDDQKGDRDEVEGRYFRGVADTFMPDGGDGRRFEPLWWAAGRYVQIVVETGEQPVTIEKVLLRETRYPLEMESEFHCDRQRLGQVMPIALRGLQMCSHETYMDCPYYEQLMYVGDTKVQALTTYAITGDDRLPRKALRAFDWSRLNSGRTKSRYPGRGGQVIPSFALWWVNMVQEYARWRDDLGFVRSLMPGARAVIEDFLGCLNEDGLLVNPAGWNYVDWVERWQWGVPPSGSGGVSAPLNWLLVLTLAQKAELEEHLGEAELAARDRRNAQSLAGRLQETFWVEERGLFSDDPAGKHFSQHAQVLAVLSGMLSHSRQARTTESLLAAEDLAPTSVYFSHYLFEAYRRTGHIEALFDRMGQWFEMLDYGLKTTYESTLEGRSDCHAWGAYPMFHYLATVLGIRPEGFGFHAVQITPQLGPVTSAYGRLVHPRGEVEVEFVVDDGALEGFVVLPEDAEGTLNWGKKSIPLQGGRQEVYL